MKRRRAEYEADTGGSGSRDAASASRSLSASTSPIRPGHMGTPARARLFSEPSVDDDDDDDDDSLALGDSDHQQHARGSVPNAEARLQEVWRQTEAVMPRVHAILAASTPGHHGGATHIRIPTVVAPERDGDAAAEEEERDVGALVPAAADRALRNRAQHAEDCFFCRYVPDRRGDKGCVAYERILDYVNKSIGSVRWPVIAATVLDMYEREIRSTAAAAWTLPRMSAGTIETHFRYCTSNAYVTLLENLDILRDLKLDAHDRVKTVSEKHYTATVATIFKAIEEERKIFSLDPAKLLFRGPAPGDLAALDATQLGAIGAQTREIAAIVATETANTGGGRTDHERRARRVFGAAQPRVVGAPTALRNHRARLFSGPEDTDAADDG